MTPQLFATYAATIRDLSPSAIDNPQAAEALVMDSVDASGQQVEMVYAPFDHVNLKARVAIVGMTPAASRPPMLFAPRSKRFVRVGRLSLPLPKQRSLRASPASPCAAIYRECST